MPVVFGSPVLEEVQLQRCSLQAALHRRQGTCLIIDGSRMSQVALPLPSYTFTLVLWMQMAVQYKWGDGFRQRNQFKLVEPRNKSEQHLPFIFVS